jgi:hypothetical protein
MQINLHILNYYLIPIEYCGSLHANSSSKRNRIRRLNSITGIFKITIQLSRFLIRIILNLTHFVFILIHINVLKRSIQISFSLSLKQL